MQIIIHHPDVDVDDDLVAFDFSVENTCFKGRLTFYGYADTFQSFANALLRQPFESKDDATFEAGGIKIVVSIADPAGSMSMSVFIEDEDRNAVRFIEQRLETDSLHTFAKRLLGHDFTASSTFEWSFVSGLNG